MGEAKRKAQRQKAPMSRLIDPMPFSIAPLKPDEASTLKDATMSYVITRSKLKALGPRPAVIHMAGDDQGQSFDLEYGAWTKEYGPNLTVAFIPVRADDKELRVFAYFNLGLKPGTCDQRRFIIDVDLTTGEAQGVRMTNDTAFEVFKDLWRQRVQIIEPNFVRHDKPFYLIHAIAAYAEAYITEAAKAA